MVFWDIRLGEGRSLKKDEVPDLFGHLLRPVRSKTGQRAPLTCWRLMRRTHDHASVWFYLVEEGGKAVFHHNIPDAASTPEAFKL